MKTRQAFTLIELLIAIALASVVIVGLLQAYNNTMKYIKTIQEIQLVNRKVCLLFNQMERDFTTAYIPPIIETIKPEKEEAKKNEKSKDQEKEKTESEKTTAEKKEIEKKLERLKNYFIAQNDDSGLARTINEHRTYLFKNVSFINSNPLQVYGQQRTRLVRVMYELTEDKKRSKGETLCYNLWRKETFDLENFKVKEDVVGFTTKSKFTQIRTHLIADGIKEFFIQYYYLGRQKPEKGKEERGAQEKIEKKILDTWGNTKETGGVVPNKVIVYVSFWDEQLSKTVTMQATFPLMSFSLIKEEKPTPQTATTSPAQASQTPPTSRAPPGPQAPPILPVTPGGR